MVWIPAFAGMTEKVRELAQLGQRGPILFHKSVELGMKISWQCIKREPAHLIKFVRFAISNGFWIDEYLKIKCNPVGFLAVLYAMNLPEADIFNFPRRGVIFFLYFPSNRVG